MLLVLVGLLSAISVKAANYDFKAENSDGVTIYYKVSGDEATVVAGDEDYMGNIIIPEIVTNDAKSYTVTTIDAYAFLNDGLLTKVVIPETMVTIGTGAFRDCSLLKEVNIPNSVTSIGNEAFSYCI